jgi:hypothetical protein
MVNAMELGRDHGGGADNPTHGPTFPKEVQRLTALLYPAYGARTR